MKYIKFNNTYNRIDVYSDSTQLHPEYYYFFYDESNVIDKENYELAKNILIDPTFKLSLLHRHSNHEQIRNICNLKINRVEVEFAGVKLNES